MEMIQNLSQLFYTRQNHVQLSQEQDSFVRELPLFNIDGSTIHGNSYKDYFIHPLVTSDTNFTLETIYPGLLVGSGYSHPVLHDVNPKKTDDISDFQLGFFFDHTTGLPVIPGSSVKGILKSVFPQNKYEGEQKENRLTYVNDLVKKVTEDTSDKITHGNWDEIFFGSVKNKRRHIFCDAYISNIPEGGKLFEDDYITPHHNNIFKEPTPIRFLKIAPGIEITFQFVLCDYDFGDGVELEKQNISNVFKQIILDFGIGAKRNVGYGQFKEN